jgi:hypothetical protein
VTSIEARTAYVHPRLAPEDAAADDAGDDADIDQPGVAGGVAVRAGDATPAVAGEDEELLDALADRHPARVVGADLVGSPAAVLARLQHGATP